MMAEATEILKLPSKCIRRAGLKGNDGLLLACAVTDFGTEIYFYPFDSDKFDQDGNHKLEKLATLRHSGCTAIAFDPSSRKLYFTTPQIRLFRFTLPYGIGFMVSSRLDQFFGGVLPAKLYLLAALESFLLVIASAFRTLIDIFRNLTLATSPEKKKQTAFAYRALTFLFDKAPLLKINFKRTLNKNGGRYLYPWPTGFAVFGETHVSGAQGNRNTQPWQSGIFLIASTGIWGKQACWYQAFKKLSGKEFLNLTNIAPGREASNVKDRSLILTEGGLHSLDLLFNNLELNAIWRWSPYSNKLEYLHGFEVIVGGAVEHPTLPLIFFFRADRNNPAKLMVRHAESNHPDSTVATDFAYPEPVQLIFRNAERLLVVLQNGVIELSFQQEELKQYANAVSEPNAVSGK